MIMFRLEDTNNRRSRHFLFATFSFAALVDIVDKFPQQVFSRTAMWENRMGDGGGSCLGTHVKPATKIHPASRPNVTAAKDRRLSWDKPGCVRVVRQSHKHEVSIS